MRFQIQRLDMVERPNGLEVTLEHNGNKINWAYRFSIRTSTARAAIGAPPRITPEELYSPLNDFLETLNPTNQAALFDIYRRIQDAFATLPNTHQLMALLKPLIAEIYAIIKLDDISRWATVNQRIHVPDDVQATFEYDEETAHKREITYTVPEYWQLLTFAIALRALMPVWGQFIDYTNKNVAPAWKEYYAYSLLNQSALWECPPMQKLRMSLNFRFDNAKIENFDSAVMEFASRDEIPEWLTGMMVVKKVMVGEIDYRLLPPTRSLVKIIYNSVKELLDKPSTKFMKGYLKDKSPDAGNLDSDGQGKSSILEAYKIPVEIIPGDQAVLNAYAVQKERIVQIIEPTLPERMLQQAMNNVKVLDQRRIFDGQRALVQLTLNEAMPVMAGQFIERAGLLVMTAVAQAVLWYRGHKALAAILTAAALPTDYPMSGDATSRLKLSKEMRATLDAMYPYARTVQQGRDRTGRQPNDGIRAIEAIVEALDKHSWQLTIPKSWMVDLMGEDTQQLRLQAIPPDIRTKLAEFAIDLDNRRSTTTGAYNPSTI
jgi:hypothetical protein